MEATYRIADETALFIKFKCEESMLYALTSNSEELIFHYATGKQVDVHMTEGGNFIRYVRVYGLVPEIPDRELAAVLGRYGQVKRVVREKFPTELSLNQYTGVRGVYMDVKKEIPSSLNFLNMKGHVSYDGNKGKCFVCKAEGHQMSSCPRRKSRKQQKADVELKQTEEKSDQDDDRSNCSLGTGSFADVVAGAATAEAVEVLDEEVMAIDEMAPETTETGKGEKASGNQDQQRVKFDYRKDPTYLRAKVLFDQQQKQQQQSEKKTEERVKLRAREKASRKQSPPRKK